MRPTVVITRAEGEQGSLASELSERGARVLMLPTIAFEPPEDMGSLDAALERPADYDWLVVTSPHAVEVLSARPAWPKVVEARLPVAAVGAVTAERLAAKGVDARVAPAEAGADGLRDLLVQGPIAGARVLWPRSDIAGRDLAQALRQAGARATEVVAYRTVPACGEAIAGFLQLLEQGEIDAITFLSPSSAENLARAFGHEDLHLFAGRTVVASIGPTTTKALRRLGAPPQAEARVRTAAGLAEAVFERLRAGKGALG